MIASALFLEAKTHTQLSLIAVLHVEAPPTSPPTSSAYNLRLQVCGITLYYNHKLCSSMLQRAVFRLVKAYDCVLNKLEHGKCIFRLSLQ